MSTHKTGRTTDGLDALLRPKSVAVVGVSSSGRGLGATTVRTIQRFGFDGPLVAINPRATEVAGVPCFPTLREVPHHVDLALLFTGGDRIRESVLDAAAAGVGAIVIFASGFAEGGADGAAREREIIELARAHGIRVLGPNCQGVVSLSSGLAATFSNALWTDEIGQPSPVAYIGQSGAIGGAVFDLGRERGCVPGLWISTGNQADLSVVELAERALDDDGLRVLMLYLESVPHADDWIPLCRRATELGKHIVLLRSGTTEVGRSAVASHTGSMVGQDEAFKLASAASGVVVVSDINELVDAAMSLVRGATPSGSRIGVVTTSGGAGGLCADMSVELGLEMATLAPETGAALVPVLSDFAQPHNPVDVTADLVSGRPHDLGEVCRLVAEDPAVDHVLVVVSAVVGKIAERIAKGIVEARGRSQKAFSVVYLSSHDRTLQVRRIFAEGGIPVFDSIGAALRATARLVSAGPVRPDSSSGHASSATSDGPVYRVLTEAEGSPVLAAAGITVPGGTLTTSRAEAESAAAELGDDLVVKLQSPQILHKTEMGLVVVGAAAAEVGALYDEMTARARQHAPHAVVEGVLVQRRVRSGVEVLIDVQVQDKGYPPVLTVGLGGTAVELYADVETGLLPVDQDTALQMLRRLRGWPLLDGFRGGQVHDVDAAAAAIVATSEVATALGPELVEFEINPLIVHEKGHGATAVDFVAHLDPTAAAPIERPVGRVSEPARAEVAR
ncbi:acetate--CoA ligase family protein [Pseudonocardia oroxyli]|uniref:Acyl-CoA synthetase (NDP forming) n=1 Tax=Pseudonocardia oroxyli TaxID=366584 RepID=A0A1G7TNE7_PSEOR|nr:acetate--CoA ligase family protein [Pseudonocardia oroxyli]SDG36846.1 Acyl-CoA synthetase (NDP forming) [Pseudonocardia oroxyli]